MIEQEELLSNPFPGLRAFEMDENYLFFGRDGQSDEVLSKLRSSHFVAVVGTSGSGKSSLVRAGLLPALFSGHMTSAGSSWRIALFRPGNNPIGNLAQALNEPDVFGTGETQDAGMLLANTETTLRRSSLGLIEIVSQARMAGQENLLIVVDQFEELFRFKQNSTAEHPEDEAAAFVRLLLESTRQKDFPIYVILTMRSDYLGDCAHFWGLPEAINEGQYLIPRMTDDGRREAVTGPVIIGGGKISAPLVNRLLNDAGDDPAQLPILQHALMRTWDYWKEHGKASEPIDIPHYEAIGAMAQALSLHADEAFNELSAPHQKIAEKLFKTLTEKGAEGREVRRPATVSEICEAAGASAEDVRTVVEVFRRVSRSFLMPPPGVPLHADTLIDISHESLIRGWHRLREWVDEESRSARIYRRLAETAVLHRQNEAGLWRDPDLQLALLWREANQPNRVWAQRYHPEFETAISFLEASKTNHETEMAEQERRRKEEIEKELRHAQALAAEQKQRAKLRNLGLIVLSLLLLMMAGTTALAVQQWYKANNALTEVAAQKKMVEQERDTAKRRTVEAEVARSDANMQRERAEGALVDTEKERDRAITAETEAARQRDAAVREQKNALAQRDIANRAEREALRQKGITESALADVKRERDTARKLKLEADVAKVEAERQTVKAQEALKTVYEIDSSVPYFKAIMRGHGGAVNRALFSPDANRVATADSDGIARVWNVDATEKFLFEQGGGRYERIKGLNFSHDGKRVVIPYANSFGSVADIVEVDTGKTLVAIKQPEQETGGNRADYATFSPDDKFVATYHFSSNDVFIWDAGTGKSVNKLTGHTGSVNSVVFSPDGSRLVTASADSTAQIWNATTGKLQTVLRGHLSEVNRAVFSHNGGLVVTASDDGTSHVWDAIRGDCLHQLPGHDGEVKSAEFSPDDQYIVTTSKNRAFLWKTASTAPCAGYKSTAPASSPTILAGHTDAVNNAVFSPDGRLVVTVSDDRTARVWKTETVPDDAPPVASLAVLRGHIKEVTSVGFGRDAKYVVTGSADRTARVWNLTGLSAFRVAAATLAAEPSEHAGECPATIKFNGTISVEGGGGTVKYKFIRSDGTSTPVQEEIFDAPGTKNVSTTWTVGAGSIQQASTVATKWQAIEILEPVSMKSNEAVIKIRCVMPTGATGASKQLTDDQLRQIMPNSTPENRARYLPHLQKAMNEFGITTSLRQAAFLTHVAHITVDLRYMTEVASDDALEHMYGGRKDMGNFEPGDGARYRGRGAFMITGRSNYQRFSEPLGIDLVAYPEQAAAPEVAFRTAGLFWQRNGINEVADTADFKGVTRRIDGNLRNIDRLTDYYNRALAILGSTPATQ